MDDDGDWVTCAVDLASGSALPLLYSLYALGGDNVLGVGLSLGGGAAALVVSSVGQGLLLSDPRRDGAPSRRIGSGRWGRSCSSWGRR